MLKMKKNFSEGFKNGVVILVFAYAIVSATILPWGLLIAGEHLGDMPYFIAAIGLGIFPVKAENWVKDFWREPRRERYRPRIRRAIFIMITIEIIATIAIIIKTATREDAYFASNLIAIFVCCTFHFFVANLLTQVPGEKLTPEEARAEELRAQIRYARSRIRGAQCKIGELMKIIRQEEECITELEAELSQSGATEQSAEKLIE